MPCCEPDLVLTLATEWIHARQTHIFKEGYKIIERGEGKDGAERGNLEAIIAGHRVKYWN